LAFFMPLLPLSLLTFKRWIEEKNLFAYVLFLVSSFIFSFSFSSPSNVLTLWIVLSLFFFTSLLNQKNAKSFIEYVSLFLIIFLSWIITNLWWLVPIMLRS